MRIRIASLLLLLIAAPGLMAAEDGTQAPLSTAGFGSPGLDQKASPQASPLTAAVQPDQQTLILPESRDFTAYDAGTCYVVQDLVKDFCRDHQDDVSCQYAP